MRHLSQKLYVVTILKRFCEDPRALVETYLNYDCDRSVDNIFQTIIEDLSKFATASGNHHRCAAAALRGETGTAGQRGVARGEGSFPLSFPSRTSAAARTGVRDPEGVQHKTGGA